MVPNVAKTGTSFKGAALYYLHDKREHWEADRLTSDRVAWTSIRNMPTDDPELAWRIMAATAMDQDRLKAEAGVKASGRKSANSVYSYSLAWHPDEKRNLSRSEMLRAADETLRVLGATGHQAMIVCHRDEPHPHVHVILNRVSPEDGRMLGTSNDRVKLSQWAEAYERERGKIWCQERVANNAKRAQGDFIRASSPTPRSMEKDFDQARGVDPAAAKRERDEAKARAAKLASAGADMGKRHKTEWEILSKRYADRKADIKAQGRAAGDRVYTQIKEQYTPQWRALYREQKQEERHFLRNERAGGIGKATNIFAELRAATQGSAPRRSFIAHGFNLATSKEARLKALQERQARERAKLQAEQRKDLKDAKAIVFREMGPLYERARKAFMSDRTALIDRQNIERAELKTDWRRETDRRSRGFKTVRRNGDLRQKVKAEATREERADSKERRNTFQGASMGRPTGKVRTRKRTRRRK
ncbi:relaxase/mobilization nuclease domain-containing protein [Aureimonas psammosilenae]|uniref:relaxase/mobilization nuclease domain-containing protein n=1 Tax=Aureimonas psammosilenae TaxID=2495496 RepID=UPI00126096F1|nr:relaxase/mobilization nuclease domain-containing protein [Aureimonas psammosilenae]